MRIIREKSIDKSAFHIGKIQYALMNGDEGERLDALEDLAELTLIIGGMGLLKICTPSMPIEQFRVGLEQTDCAWMKGE